MSFASDNRAILELLCHSFTALIFNSFARHYEAFSGFPSVFAGYYFAIRK